MYFLNSDYLRELGIVLDEDHQSDISSQKVSQSSTDQSSRELLEKECQRLKSSEEALLKENRLLKANISSLYKSALSEIRRKDHQISELRNQLDDIILRRENRNRRSREETQPRHQHTTADHLINTSIV